jgi:predicted metal-binding protein
MAFDYEELERYSLELGVSAAKVFDVSDIVVDERVRMKCEVPFCPDFGTCLVCPPNSMSVDEFRKILTKYQKALLIQGKVEFTKTAGGGTDQFDMSPDLAKLELQLHKWVNKIESKAMSMGAYFATGFKASKCRLCEKCVGISDPGGCKHPYLARPSVEGVGVDVIATAERVGLGFKLFGEGEMANEIVYTGLVLID